MRVQSFHLCIPTPVHARIASSPVPAVGLRSMRKPLTHGSLGEALGPYVTEMGKQRPFEKILVLTENFYNVN